MVYNAGMGIFLRLGLILMPVSALPVLGFTAALSVFGAGYAVSAALAAGLAVIGALLAALAVVHGLGRPVVKLSSAVKAFMAADYKLEEVILREGWPEAAGLISALNCRVSPTGTQYRPTNSDPPFQVVF